MANAIQAIYRDLEYAVTLTRQRAAFSATPHSPTNADDQQTVGGEEPDDMDEEESWTFIDDYTDMELPKNEGVSQNITSPTVARQS